MFSGLPCVGAVVRSAAAAAGRGLVSVSVRPSARAAGGWVVVPVFSRRSLAARFAAVWSGRLPAVCRGCVVRPVAGGFAVSVPVVGVGRRPVSSVALVLAWALFRSAGGRFAFGEFLSVAWGFCG